MTLWGAAVSRVFCPPVAGMCVGFLPPACPELAALWHACSSGGYVHSPRQYLMCPQLALLLRSISAMVLPDRGRSEAEPGRRTRRSGFWLLGLPVLLKPLLSLAFLRCFS